MESCALCEADIEIQERVWHAYANRLHTKEARRVIRKALAVEMRLDDIEEHLWYHHYIQPAPAGKMRRSEALQEALTTFPRHLYYLLRALYRAEALSRRQIYSMFYLDHASDAPELRQRLDQELRRLVFRSFLYQHWPENRGALQFEDPGPFYCINRQSIPVLEKLEGIPAGDLPFTAYTTSIEQIKEHDMEQRLRFLDVVVAMRSQLYQRGFAWGDQEINVHLAIEHWYSSAMLTGPIEVAGKESEFSPDTLLGLRLEARGGSISSLLPLWLEYDRGLDTPEDIAARILTYAAYYRSKTFQEKFPRLADSKVTGPLVCVCENSYRRDEVAQALADRLGEHQAPLYLADRPTLVHDPYAPGILVSPNQGGERFSLLERVVQHGRKLMDDRVFSGSDHLTDPLFSHLLQAGSRVENARTVAVGKRDAVAPVDLSGWGDS